MTLVVLTFEPHNCLHDYHFLLTQDCMWRLQGYCMTCL